jgi:hypothetical protein
MAIDNLQGLITTAKKSGRNCMKMRKSNSKQEEKAMTRTKEIKKDKKTKHVRLEPTASKLQLLSMGGACEVQHGEFHQLDSIWLRQVRLSFRVVGLISLVM